MTDDKVILVIGATGAQGGGVARHLLNSGRFTVRCLTRNPSSEKAIALQEAGAEVVKGDFGEPESLKTAMKGCYGVFGVINFWEHFDKTYELGKNLIDVVVASNIKHFVFSTLPNAKKISGEKIEVPHFDIQAKLEEYACSLELNVTFVHPAFYYENFLSYFPPKKQENGTFAFGFPQGDTLLAGIAIEDLGGVVTAIFDKPDDFKDKTIGVVGDDLSGKEYAEIMTKVLEKNIIYNYITREVFAKFDFPGAQDLASMFEFNRLHISNRKEDLEESRRLYPKMQTFESWLTANKEKFKDILKD